MLEGGRALTFSSGMAAAHAVLELLPPGGVMVIPHNCYLGVAEAVDRPRRDVWRPGPTGQHRQHHRGVECRRRRRCRVDRVARQSDDRGGRPSCAWAAISPVRRSSLSTTPSLRRYCSVLWSLAPTSCCTRQPSCFQVIPMSCSAYS